MRAAAALRRLDPADPALDRQTFGVVAPRARPVATNAIAALWNLIALPTLNLPAGEARSRLAVKVFRTGLLDAADACDIGVPAVPFQRLHARAGRRGARARRRAVRARHPGARGRRRPEPVLDDGADDVDAVDPRRAARRSRGSSPPAPSTARRLAGLGTSPIVNLHVHYDRRVLDEPLARRARLAGAVALRPHPGRPAPREGQLVAVSLSHAVERDRRLGRRAARPLPARARAAPAGRRAAREVLDFAVTHEPRATFRAAPGTARLRPGPRTAVPGVYLAGAWTDTGWPATMESAVRSGLAAAELAARRARAGTLPTEAAA